MQYKQLTPLALSSLPDRPLISIIVPSYNQGRFIRATIDSILAQDYRPIRIHVIDGASTDETVDVLRSYGDIPELDWVSEPDKGVVEAVNKGFERVTGDIVAIQSADDCYLPEALDKIAETFKLHADVGLVYGDTVKVDEAGRELQRNQIGPWSLENLLLIKTWIPQPSCFFRRELLAVCGNWDESVSYAADTDMWLRMVFRTQVMKLDQYLSQRRMHEQQRDQQTARIYRDYCKMIQGSADLASAPRHLQRAAKAGCALLYRRYNPTGSLLRAFAHDLKAWVIYPKSFEWRRFWLNGVIIPLRMLLNPLAPAKRWLGCWLNERARAEFALSPWLSRCVGIGWVDLTNRHDLIHQGDEPAARQVLCEFTSYLTVTQMFPRVGGRLLQKAFSDCPLPNLRKRTNVVAQDPRVSVIIPVGGRERRANFQLVLNCLLNQSEDKIQIIVLEHSISADYEDVLPRGVLYAHVAMNSEKEEFNKSLMFNMGVALADAQSVMLHDADILVPESYVATALNQLDCGFEATRPLRLLFYFSQQDTSHFVEHLQFPTRQEIEVVAQNLLGGSTLIRKNVYQELGGHDERFLGWGGEDLEFLERLQTRKLFKGGVYPGIHLWHPPAQKKTSGDKNLDLLKALRLTSPSERIGVLNTLVDRVAN